MLGSQTEHAMKEYFLSQDAQTLCVSLGSILFPLPSLKGLAARGDEVCIASTDLGTLAKEGEPNVSELAFLNPWL